jgi:UDP:flavonoid glycosyltransferase YjiC (YdhE family)
VQRIGAGVVVPPAERTAAGIRAAVDQVLDDPSYALAAGRADAEIAQIPTADAVLADLIDGARAQAA